MAPTTTSQPFLGPLAGMRQPRKPAGHPGFDFTSFQTSAERVGVDPDQMARIVGADIAKVLDAVAAGSPFLAMLANSDPARLVDILHSDPTERLSATIAALDAASRSIEPTQAGLAELSARARRAKADAALLIGLADLAGIFELEQVTEALSDLADAALAAGVRFLFRQAREKGRWKGDGDDIGDRSGYFVLAMGKHGGRELNYSSDIDLIVLYDREIVMPQLDGEPQPFLVKLTQDLVRFMSFRTAEGYVFRTDLRLRPDPGATQVALSTDAAAHYYESFGQNWERAALIKARPVAGDVGCGAHFLRELSPFIWRKYLDFAAIADIHAMKRQIHAHKGFARIAVAGHNIKVGRGGIREIEFFAQTQQLIAGGRQSDLRCARTCETLARLHERDWIGDRALIELIEAYRFLRTIEHRLQMIADEQTQTLPRDETALTALALFCGFDTLKQFTTELHARLTTVQGHYAALFEDVPELTKGNSNLVFAGEEDDPGTVAALSAMGFKDPARALGIVRSWHRGRYRAMASAVARERLTEIQPVLIDSLAQTVDPDTALIGFDRLLSQLPAGVQLFSLLHAQPSLLRLIADITGSAPRLARILARRRRVIDAVLDPRVIGAALPSQEALTEVVSSEIESAPSYEDSLDRARVIGAEQAFVIGVRILAGVIDAGDAGRAYTELAEVLIDRLHNRVQRDFIERHGTVDGGGSAIVAMGKLGGREMTASSDLDLIVIYNAAEAAKMSSGPRELAVSQYYARLTQRLTTALAAPTAEGSLYEVDLRLRPSGQKGPVATSLASFTAYQSAEAWTWEHMALTRARVISGPPVLVASIRDAITRVLTAPRDPVALTRDVRDMRERIHREKGTADLWDLKHVRGGLIDLEFAAQYLQLAHAARHPDVLDQNTRRAFVALDRHGLLGRHGEALISACDLLHTLTQILRLCFDGPFDPASAPDGLKGLLAEVAGLPAFDPLQSHLREVQAGVRAIFDELVVADP